MEGVVGVDHRRRRRRGAPSPSAVGVTAPVHYYCAATDKVRFVGEPVAVVVARDRYLAEDAAEARRRRLRAAARRRRPRARARARRARPARGGRLQPGRPPPARLRRSRPRLRARPTSSIRERFRFPKYGSTPIETYGVIARWDPLDGVLHGLVELHGAVHHAPARRAGAGAAREPAALHRAARHRRQLRHQVEHLPVHRADRAGRHEAPACR